LNWSEFDVWVANKRIDNPISVLSGFRVFGGVNNLGPGNFAKRFDDNLPSHDSITYAF